jgi:hypothetical protein
MMYRITKLLTLSAGADTAALIHDLRVTTGSSRQVLDSALAPTLPEASATGDLIWRLHFANEADASAWAAEDGRAAQAIMNDRARVREVNSVGYVGGRAGSKQMLERGIYRFLLIRLDEAASSADGAQFEYETYEMGHYIPSIVQWRISRVSEGSGTSAWTHLWEQEYQDLDGLLKTYMLHPHHWAWINRWYDPECPEHIVRTVCQSFCRFDGSTF